MTLARTLRSTVEERLGGFPVVTITGPRQSGKTTLAKLIRPDVGYYSLEDPDVRGYAIEDPRGFLRQCGDAAILDEVQRVPCLYFLRDKQGLEIDVLVEDGPDSFKAIEVKSGQTIHSDAFLGLNYWRKQLPEVTFDAWFVYGGDSVRLGENVEVLPWQELPSLTMA